MDTEYCLKNSTSASLTATATYTTGTPPTPRTQTATVPAQTGSTPGSVTINIPNDAVGNVTFSDGTATAPIPPVVGTYFGTGDKIIVTVPSPHGHSKGQTTPVYNVTGS